MINAKWEHDAVKKCPLGASIAHEFFKLSHNHFMQEKRDFLPEK